MYSEIQELKMGYKKQQAARELEIDTKTLRKYWSMSEEEYIEYRQQMLILLLSRLDQFLESV